MIFESQYILNQCKDKITVSGACGLRIFTQVQCLKFTRCYFSVYARKGCEKSNVAVQIDARIQSSNLHLTSRARGAAFEVGGRAPPPQLKREMGGGG